MIYPFKVNGEPLLSKFPRLVSLDVLERAVLRKAVALPIANQYKLFHGGKTFGHDEWVDLQNSPEFIAVPIGPARAC